MSTKSNNKIPEITFEMNLKFQMKNYNFTLRVNPKIVLSILLPIIVKITSMLLNHYGVAAP